MFEYKIIGDDMQILEVQLAPGQSVFANPETVLYMEEGVKMRPRAIGGFFEGVKRLFAGEKFFVSVFKNKTKDVKTVGFAAPIPGKIMPLEIGKSKFLCNKNAFLCAEESVDISIALIEKFESGPFNKESFVLEELRGKGTVFLNACGEILKRELNNPRL